LIPPFHCTSHKLHPLGVKSKAGLLGSDSYLVNPNIILSSELNNGVHPVFFAADLEQPFIELGGNQ
jgi:hypothetical protein